MEGSTDDYNGGMSDDWHDELPDCLYDGIVLERCDRKSDGACEGNEDSSIG